MVSLSYKEFFNTDKEIGLMNNNIYDVAIVGEVLLEAEGIVMDRDYREV